MKPIIKLIYDEPKFKIDTENMVYEAVQKIGVNVDKERLKKALMDSRSFYNEGYADAKKKYDKKWIPCKERLPKYDECVLTCNVHGEIDMMYLFEDVERHEDVWLDVFENTHDDIIAWQPLPKPYEEKENVD